MSAISVINQHTNVGFYGAPVSKSLMLIVGCSHAATHLPAFSALRKMLKVTPHDMTSWPSLLQLLPSKLVFPDTRDTILVLFLIYFFRVFERRYGSLKFSSCLLLSFSCSVLLEVSSAWCTGLFQPGPLALVLPLFVPYYLHIPVLSSAMFGQVPVSSKSLTYLLGLQLLVTSRNHVAASLCSLVAGVVYCTPLVDKFRIPSFLGRLFSATLGQLVVSPAPEVEGTNLLGATLEVQRVQQSEALEQQLLRARNRHNVPIGGRQMRLNEFWGGAGGGHLGQARQEQQPPSPEMVQTLVDMGFSQQRAVQALQQSGGDLDQATNILLQDIM